MTGPDDVRPVVVSEEGEPEVWALSAPVLMHVYAEVWPVAADAAGIWLLSGDGPWPSLPVTQDSEPHVAAELELIQHSALAETALMHSTSWRVDGPAVVVTYLAVVRCSGPVREHWPNARPVSTRLAEVVGRPPTHGPTEPPAPRYWDVLLHGLRHLAFLLPRDATVAGALDETWGEHLAAFSPAIARMYDRAHTPA